MATKKNGFTMVEVIIVVAIISVLASIIIPKMTGAKDKSKLESCKYNLKNLSTAASIYMSDNGTTPTEGNITQTHVLVTDGYLKSMPVCPTRPPGTVSYQFGSNTARYSTLDYYFLCLNTSGQWHYGVPSSRPAHYMGHGFVPY